MRMDTQTGTVADSTDTDTATVAFVFDGSGHGHAVVEGDLEASGATTDQGFIWIHINRKNPRAMSWLRNSGLDYFVLDALTAEETRPRCTVHGDGAVINLRGVNLNPGAEPEDMISIRLWVEERRVISVGARPLKAVWAMIEAFNKEHCPQRPGDLVAQIALRLADAAEPTVSALNERVDEMEELVVDEIESVPRHQLGDIRRMAIMLRRYMVPQRDALSTLEIEDLPWLDNRDRSRIREAVDRVSRLGEELDAIRDRAQVIHDQIMDMRAEMMNRQTLVLAVVAAIFLPLGLLTGLLGINVGGIPGEHYGWAFAIVCGVLVVLAAFQIWLYRRIGLF